MSLASDTVLVMSPDHPWRRLRRLTRVELLWRRTPGRLGATNGVDLIVMNPDQLQVERRCTLAHELAHIELGHTGGCSSVGEAAARRLAARWLIRMDDLVDAYRWAEALEEVADCLWVDVDTLRARLDSLTPDETARLVHLYRETERGC